VGRADVDHAAVRCLLDDQPCVPKLAFGLPQTYGASSAQPSALVLSV
jgi:hypothetical protein